MVNRILLLIGSLGFLLYGMKLMSDGVQKSAGGHLKKALGFMTGNRFIGLFTGIFITMIIQSSGATTVMVVSFVNAGLITLTQSVGVIFGANIGTTVTAWIVSIFGFNFKISAFAIPLFGLGFFMTFLKKNGL
ncbi:Na/Pi symporter, partial [Treponema sp.]|uniref:Na/Pi symporter n=1 Tax=Treponema sp. TaxID=166 RepID=UPI0025D2B987